jgi:hypothetical protein
MRKLPPGRPRRGDLAPAIGLPQLETLVIAKELHACVG